MARRRIIRPQVNTAAHSQNRQRYVQKLQARQEQERQALARWQKKLKRAFNAVARLQKSLARLERILTTTENP